MCAYIAVMNVQAHIPTHTNTHIAGTAVESTPHRWKPNSFSKCLLCPLPHTSPICSLPQCPSSSSSSHSSTGGESGSSFFSCLPFFSVFLYISPLLSALFSSLFQQCKHTDAASIYKLIIQLLGVGSLLTVETATTVILQHQKSSDTRGGSSRVRPHSQIEE